MNTNFVDISASVSPLPQNGLSTAGTGGAVIASGTGKTAGTGQKFEEQFQKEINRLEIAVEKGAKRASSTSEHGQVQQSATTISDTKTSVVKTAKVKTAKVKTAKVKTAVEDTAVEETAGLEFLSKLEALLTRISNGDLKGTQMDSQGLDALKMLLVKAGFDPDEVKSVIADLKTKSKTEKLSLEDVLTSLSDLVVEVDEKATPEAVYMETSALPFIKDMLSRMDLGDEKIDAILEEADKGSNGISLDVIIENLKTLEAANREGGKALTISDSDGSFKSLMAQLNLPGADTEQETVSINDLIKAFEAYKLNKQETDSKSDTLSRKVADAVSNLGQGADAGSAVLPSGNTGRKETGNLLNTLFQSLSSVSKTEDASFSYQQTKDQFVNDMMIPEKADGGMKGLFSPHQIPGDVKTDEMVKELATLAAEKNGSSSGRKMGSAESLGKDHRHELSKAEAVFQGSGGAEKEIDASSSPSRAKAAPRTLPAYVTQQVGRGIARAVNKGESTLRLQLKPPELGRLTMTIDHQSTGVKVSIVTENQSARDLLASNVNELKSALSSAGISLESFDVDMNSDFKQSMANAGNQDGQFGRNNGNRSGNGSSAQGNQAADEVAAITGELVTDGSYHFVA